jgi:hypothetical protein
VCLNEVMKKIMPTPDAMANSQPGQLIFRKLDKAPVLSMASMIAAMPIAPNTPRHASIVQLSSGMRRVKNPAVLQAMADAMTSTSPDRYSDQLIGFLVTNTGAQEQRVY